MNTLIHADIFFFISAIAVAVFTVALIIAAVLVIQTLVETKAFVRRVRSETDRVFDLADSIAEKAGGWAGAVGGLGYRLWSAQRKNTSKKAKKSSK